ncbi:hypothetical protein K438DRAFT_715842 [Mycena galopus ATCC 62051]|nr:hypothetical protein K438DRAFT_715842 [Mycena galopus ATCC 62051]
MVCCKQFLTVLMSGSNCKPNAVFRQNTVVLLWTLLCACAYCSDYTGRFHIYCGPNSAQDWFAVVEPRSRPFRA